MMVTRPARSRPTRLSWIAILVAAGFTTWMLATAPRVRAEGSTALPRLVTSWGTPVREGVRPPRGVWLSGTNFLMFAGSPRHRLFHAKHFAMPRGGYPIRWTRWTTREAVGSGSLYYSSCDPACVSGGIDSEAGTIRLLDPSEGRFTRLEIRHVTGHRRSFWRGQLDVTFGEEREAVFWQDV
jgi:hypothetical protein